MTPKEQLRAAVASLQAYVAKAHPHVTVAEVLQQPNEFALIAQDPDANHDIGFVYGYSAASGLSLRQLLVEEH